MTDLAGLKIDVQSGTVEEAVRRLRELTEAATNATVAEQRLRTEQLRRAQEALDAERKLTREVQLRSRTAEAAQRRLRREVELGANAVDRFSRNLSNLFRAATFVGGGLLGVGIARNAVNSIAEYERGLVGVAKTTNSTADETKILDERFRAMALSAKAPLVELLQYGRIAGQLGVRGTENIAKFSLTMSKLALATQDIRGEEGALQLSKLVNLTRTSPADVDRLADSLVQLGNTIGATEGNILRTATFVGASLASFRTSSQDVLGFAGAVAALGQRAETSATTFYKSFSLISQAVAAGGKQLELFAAVAGMSADDFAATFNRSSTDAFVAFLGGLDRTVQGGAQLQEVLKALGFEASDSARVLAALSANVGLVQKSLLESARGYRENKAATDESDRALNTLQGSLDKLSNTYKLFLVNLGDQGLSGALRGTIDLLREVFIIFSGLEPATEGVSNKARLAAVAIAALGVALSGLLLAKFVTLLIAAANAFGLLNTAAVRFGVTMRLNPLTAIVTTISAVIGVALGASNAFDEMSESAKRLRAATQDLQDTASRIKEIQNALDFARQTKNSVKEIEALTRQLTELERIGQTAGTDREFLKTIVGDPKLVDDLSKQFENLGSRAVLSMSPAILKLRALYDELNRVSKIYPQQYPGGPDKRFERIQELEKQINDSLAGGNQAVTAYVQERMAAIRQAIDDINKAAANQTLVTTFSEARVASDGFLESLRQQTKLLAINVKDGERAAEVAEAVAKAEEKLGDQAIPDREAYLNLIRQEIIEQQRLNDLIDARTDLQKQLEKEKDAYYDAQQSLDEFLGGLLQEIELLTYAKDAREEEAAVMEYMALAQKGLVDVTEDEINMLRGLIRVKQQLEKFDDPRQEARDPQERAVRALKAELEAATQTRVEREITLQMAQIQEQYMRQGVELTKDQVATRRRELEVLRQQLEVIEAFRDIGAEIGSALGQGIKQAIKEGGKLRDFILNLLDSIWQAVFDRLVGQILADQIASLMSKLGLAVAGSTITPSATSSPSAIGAPAVDPYANARGNAYASGRIIPFARGGALDRGLAASLGTGVVSAPTLAPMALIGEGAREEAIMPLERTVRGDRAIMAVVNGRRTSLPIGRLADGNLGVQIEGGTRRFRMGGVVGSTRSPYSYGGAQSDPAAAAARMGVPVASRGSTVNVYQTITTPNPDAFRSSQSQILATAKRGAKLGA